MIDEAGLMRAVFEGWQTNQEALMKALAPLGTDQLLYRASSDLRSVREITAHIIGARARWFYMLMGEGGDEFDALGRWDRRGAKVRSAHELVQGLEATWRGMHAAIARWSLKEWGQTWPGEDDGEPEVLTRQWVIWHLIEHDVHHGGEISITLGAHGAAGVAL